MYNVYVNLCIMNMMIKQEKEIDIQTDRQTDREGLKVSKS